MVIKTPLFKADLPGAVRMRRMEWFAPARLFPAMADKPGFIWLDSGMDQGGAGRWSFMMWSPAQAISGSVGEFIQTIPGNKAWKTSSPFDAIKRILRENAAPPQEGAPPFTGGVAGFFGYGLQRLSEPSTRLAAKPPAPEGDVWLGVYPAVAAFDHGRSEVILAARPMEGMDVEQSLDRMEAQIRQGLAQAAAAPRIISSARNGHIKSNFTREGYMAAVEKVRRYIEAGDCYQANIAQRFTVEDVFGGLLYLRLRAINPAPFGAYINTGAAQILSVSPERFIRVENGMAAASPIKGTRPRGHAPMEDNLLKLELAESEKDRAENVMIVDLLRNDLSRVCMPGSVRVESLCALETHPQVFHLVSTVAGRLRPGLGAVDLLERSFPGGSVTGAPKIRAMEIIDEIEPDPRGAYCGALGYIGFDGAMDTSVVIRTMVRHGGNITFHAGGGVTWPSDPAAEYQETLDKARAMMEAAS